VTTADPSVYQVAERHADVVRALAVIESGEDEAALGQGGKAFGLLQMRPGAFAQLYHPTEQDADDTVSEAQVKACARYLSVYRFLSSTVEQQKRIIMAWSLGEYAVFVDGREDEQYYNRWLDAFKRLGSEART
jgi:hypothetical protein